MASVLGHSDCEFWCEKHKLDESILESRRSNESEDIYMLYRTLTLFTMGMCPS